MEKYEFPVQVLAYRWGEYENKGIPADIIELKDKTDDKPLFLQKNKYTIVVRDRNYEVRDVFTVIVGE